MRAMHILVAAFLMYSSAGFSAPIESPCKDTFTAFFERSFLYIPEIPHRKKMEALGKAVISDIEESTLVTPDSELATQGYAGLGKCSTVVMRDPEATGHLIQGDSSLVVTALVADKTATYNLREDDQLFNNQCRDFHGALKGYAVTAILSPTFNAWFDDGKYYVQLPGYLKPFEKELRLTKDQKFLLTLSENNIFNGNAYRRVCAHKIN